MVFTKTAKNFGIVLHLPQADGDRKELARRIASIHADSIYEKIRSLNIPAAQKLQLMDDIIADAKSRAASLSGRKK